MRSNPDETPETRPLSELGLTARGGADPLIAGLAVDSRKVAKGCLFAALPGSLVHGAKFIPAALEQGATAILTDAAGARIAAQPLADSHAALVIAEDPRQALAYAAALWFGAQPATMVAVTGTNGKTSVATFVRQIWCELGHAAVNLGTTGIEGAWSHPLAHTTPEPITLHAALASPDVSARIAKLGAKASPSTGDEMRAMIERQIGVWKSVVDTAGIEKR